MQSRHLFLVGYDISSAKRLAKALKAVRAHATGGQKSFYECWLSVGELQDVMAALRQILDPEADRAVFVRLDGSAQSIALGAAEPVDNGEFILVA